MGANSLTQGDKPKNTSGSGEMGAFNSSASTSREDLEVGNAELHRGLNSFHLQFIAIGGTIGTGLFLGSGTALATAGPVGTLIAFIFVGSITYSVMASLGEMATYLPVAGSFTAYASQFLDPSLGFAMGWIYWFCWAVTYALELVAAGLIIQYWNDSLSIGIFIAVFWVIFTGLNFMPIKWFGEFEMWFSSIKVITIVGFIIFAICIDAGVGQNGYLGFSAWVEPGPFNEYVVEGAAGKFVSFWTVLVTAGFSFQGAELVGVGAGEVENPEKNVPRAIRWTFWGIYTLFVATVFFIGLIVPSDTPELLLGTTNAAASPLVIAANLAGIPVLPHIINAVLLTAVLSAANSNVYSGSRILVALAKEKHAPEFLTYTNKHGVPYGAVGVTSAVGLLAFINLSPGGENVFTWLLNITAIAGFISWSCILMCHLRFQKILAHLGVSRATDLAYTARFQPYLTWFGLFFCILIILTNGFVSFIEWSVSGFFTAYISLILFVALYVGHKLLVNRNWTFIKVEDVVLDRGHASEKN